MEKDPYGLKGAPEVQDARYVTIRTPFLLFMFGLVTLVNLLVIPSWLELPALAQALNFLRLPLLAYGWWLYLRTPAGPHALLFVVFGTYLLGSAARLAGDWQAGRPLDIFSAAMLLLSLALLGWAAQRSTKRR